MDRHDRSTLDLAAMAARLAAGKDAVAMEFFGDLPENLRDELYLGWRVYEERRTVRAAAGVPLPPGGSFVLGWRAVVAGLLAEIHNSVAQALRCPAESVRLVPSEDGIGVEAYLPDTWIPPGGRLPTDTVRRAAELYVKAVAEDADEQFRKLRTFRLAAAALVRADLIPDVEGW